ncbi:MAG: hypothetical protein IJU53_03200 [Thermoguttaceae bacterium]|nr:hypothetical protein [Thermoguttaceae bacterium]
MNEDLLNEEKKTLDSNDSPTKSCLLMIVMIILAFVLIGFINRIPGSSKAPEKTEAPAASVPAEIPTK